MRGKFTICSIKFHVNFSQWCRIMRLEYVIKCRLSTRKWHVIWRGLMWQNGIWLVEYISSKWTIASCSCSAMIGYVVIGLWMMFSQYVMEFKLFGVCIVRKGAEKTRFIWKNYTIKINANLSYSEKSRPHSLERHNHKTFQMSSRFLVNVAAPWFHDIIYMKTIPKRCDWCMICKRCDMIGATYIPLCGNLIGARYKP